MSSALSTSCPAALGSLKGFLSRAEEVENRDPRMAYFCRQYAAQLGVELHQSNRGNKEVAAFLGRLLEKLETEKETLASAGILPDDGLAYVKGFSMKIFMAADDADRAGTRTMGTAKSFFASSTFFEVCGLFGTVESAVKEKIRYSKWRAAEIAKGLKSGTPIADPPVAGDDMEEDKSSTVASSASFVPVPSAPPPPYTTSSGPSTNTLPAGGLYNLYNAPPPSYASVPVYSQNPPTPFAPQPAPRQPVSAPTAAPVSRTLANVPPVVPSKAAAPVAVIAKAQKNCKEAISALQFDDVATAVRILKDALQSLEPFA
eukprot:ANDGO_00020.mRNA.1 Protein HOMOLOG OF MAMMALIAN LYST-INTERACTING PROTEIN 5